MNKFAWYHDNEQKTFLNSQDEGIVKQLKAFGIICLALSLPLLAALVTEYCW